MTTPCLAAGMRTTGLWFRTRIRTTLSFVCGHGSAVRRLTRKSPVDRGCGARTGALTVALAHVQLTDHIVSASQAAAASDTLVNHLFNLADLDAKTAGNLAAVLRPVLSLSILLFIVRIVLSWYPQIDGKKLPWSIVVAPTEPLLKPTRQLIQPVGGVDVSPIVWVAVLSFLNEILLGPQGILNLLQRKLDL
eukprot:jgi/Botrbrau1/19060/Bobra.0100s0084.1